VTRITGTTGERGFTLTELLVSTAIMMTVTGAIFSLMNPAQGSAQVQPEVADLQQRMRIGGELLFKDLVIAGAGPYQGNSTGSLVNFFAPILPRRTGKITPDPTQGPASVKTDAITLVYIPNTYSQTTLFDPMPNVSAELKVNKPSNCPGADPLCGFKEGMGIVIFDSSGNFDAFTVTEVQGAAGHIQHRGQQFSVAYPTGSQVTEIVSYTYYLDRNTNQLRRYDGYDTDVPVVDNVVDLRFDYFGDSQPPRLPKPPPGTANCLYDAAGNYLNLPVLPSTDGSLAVLSTAMLADGPYCGGGTNQFDADLLRIRKVRVTLRMQIANAALRGGTALDGSKRTVSSSDRAIPDYIVSFDVAPRNLNLSR
jgi:Prokaryotic N-terminal methylation motif